MMNRISLGEGSIEIYKSFAFSNTEQSKARFEYRRCHILSAVENERLLENKVSNRRARYLDDTSLRV